MSSNQEYRKETAAIWEVQEQPQYKFLERGMAALTDAELLSLIIGSGSQAASATELSKKLLETLGGLQGIARATVQDLMRIHGVGKAKAVRIVAGFEMYRRKAKQGLWKTRLNSAQAVYQYLGPTLADLDHEVFYVLYLNKNHELKSQKQLFEGGINATIIDTRMIFKEAVLQLASGIIMVHNHPSGNLKPSHPDRLITRKCQEAGKLFDIPVLDHIIISSRGFYSFANQGEM